MNEELAIHEEEWHIMDRPDEEEEARIIPQTVTYSCGKIKLFLENDQSEQESTYGQG